MASQNNYNFTIDASVKIVERIASNANLIITFLGIVNNAICIGVFSQKKLLQRKFNIYLLVLTIFEMIFCTVLFADYIYSKFNTHGIFLHNLNKYMRILISFLVEASDSYIGILTAILSLDRLYAIKYPLEINDFVTHRHVRSLIAVPLIALIILKTSSFILCEHHLNNDFQIIYCSIVSPLLFNALPFISVLFLNSILVKEIISYYRNQEGLKKNLTEGDISLELLDMKSSSFLVRKFCKKEETHSKKSHYVVILLTNIWSILTIIPFYYFISCFTLININSFSTCFDSKTVIIGQMVASIFFNSNHCINFFIYLCFYDDFRYSLRDFFIYFKESKVINV